MRERCVVTEEDDEVESGEAIRSLLRQRLEAERALGPRFVPLPAGTWAAVPAKAPPAAGMGLTTAGKPGSPMVRRSSRQAEKLAGDEGNRAALAAERLRVLDETQVRGCTRCGLSRERTRTVFGQGHPAPRLVFVGEAPGFEEDRQGLAFVGKAGQLLTKMIGAMGLTRDEVFICNTVKCRPPQNRVPAAEEILACQPFLHTQLAILQPEVIVALGAPAAKSLLGTAESISRLRGRFHEYTLPGEGGDAGATIPLMPTFHPAYLLRSPEEKRKAWDDLQQVMALLGLERPAESSG